MKRAAECPTEIIAFKPSVVRFTDLRSFYILIPALKRWAIIIRRLRRLLQQSRSSPKKFSRYNFRIRSLMEDLETGITAEVSFASPADDRIRPSRSS